MRKLVATISFLIFLSSPAFAGMEPFFKGEWGMGQDEISALHTGETPHIGSRNNPDLKTMIYNTKEPDVIYRIRYFFIEKTDRLSMVDTQLIYQNVTPPEAQAIMDKIMNDISGNANSADPFRHCIISSDVFESTVETGRYLWVNQTTAIDLSFKHQLEGQWIRFEISFSDMQNPVFEEVIRFYLDKLDNCK